MAPQQALREAVAAAGVRSPARYETGTSRDDISLRSEKPRPGGSREVADPLELRVLMKLAVRLEAMVHGPEKRGLARQLVRTLSDLSQRLQSRDRPTWGMGAPSAVILEVGLQNVPSEGKSPHLMSLVTDLKASGGRSSPMIAVVDRDPDFRSAICMALEAEGLTVDSFANCELFLSAQTSGSPACLIIDSDLPGMTGLKLLRTLSDQGHALPVIVVAGQGGAPNAVRALKAGVIDFLEKPIRSDVLMASVERALSRRRESERFNVDHDAAANHLLGLTPRQRQVMDLILAGHPSKNIAADIGVSQRTVESHRAEVMRKTGAKSMPALARLAASAAGTTDLLCLDFGPKVALETVGG